MPRPRLAASLALTLGLATPLVALATPAGAATPVDTISPSLTTVNLLSINDFHGRIEANARSDKGLALACTYVNTRNGLGAERTALVSAGDNIGAATFTSASQQDTPTLQYLNALGLQVSAVGNHEFDRGFEDLTGRVSDTADFDYLGANVYRKGTQTPALPEYSVRTINGVRIGFVGAVTAQTASMVSPAGISTIDFGDPVAAVNRVSAQLRDGNAGNGEADVVVALYHEGAPGSAPQTLDQQKTASQAFARIVDDTATSVDVIYNAHTHQTYVYDAGSGDARRPVMQSSSYGTNLGSLQLGYDPQTRRVTQYVASNVAVPDAPAQPAGVPAGTPDESQCGSDPTYQQVRTLVLDAKTTADQVGNEPVGAVSADVTRAWAGSSRDDRSRESTLGNHVAQAWLEALNQEGRPGADIGIMNPGGVRADLLHAPSGGEGAGVVTRKEAFNVNPFANTLQVTTITGAQFRTVLEQQWQPAGASRPFLKLGLSQNVSYTYDPNRPAGQRVTSVTVNGAPIDPAKDYRVTAGSFLISGGDNFTELGKGRNSTDTGMNDAEEWVKYLERHNPTAPSFAKQAVAVVNPPSAIFGTGTLRVEGLDLTSSGSPDNTALTARLGDREVGTAPVRNENLATPLPTRDGVSELTVTVPPGTEPGPATLTLTAQPTGTTVSVPVRLNQLASGQTLTSPNGQCRLVNQTDGNQVVYDATGYRWATFLMARGSTFNLGGDGDLTVTNASGGVLWKAGKPGAGNRLVLQDDCNLVLYSAAGAALWDSSGFTAPRVPSRFGPAQQLSNGGYTLGMQGDGNLVLYRDGRAVWHTGTYGNPGAWLAVQGTDGNLVVLSSRNRPLWQAGLSRPGSRDVRLTLTENGLAAYRNGEPRPYWTVR